MRVESVVPRRLSSIDALRGIGTLWVLWIHIPHDKPGPIGLWYLVTLPLNSAYAAFVLLMVVSGFCIHMTAARNLAVTGAANLKWTDFWKRRFRRLYPPYLVAIVFSLVLNQITPYDPSYRQPPLIPDLITHLAMVHNLIPVFAFGLGNVVFWSLGLEEQLYALYAPLLKIRSRRSIQKSTALVFIVGLVWIIGLSLTSPSLRIVAWWSWWPFTFWFAWTLGAFAAEIYVGEVKYRYVYHSRLLALALFLIGIATGYPVLGLLIRTNLFVSHFGTGTMVSICQVLIRTSDLFFAGASFILINILASAEKRGTPYRIPRFLPWVGLFSYSLYLTHYPIVRFVQAYGLNGPSATETIVRFIIVTTICLGFAWLFFHVVEKRYLNRKPTGVRIGGRVESQAATKQINVGFDPL